MVLVLEDDFEFILATFHWCQSSTTSLMIVPIWILLMSTLEIALANIHQDVADVHQCNKVDFPYLLFLCAFFMTSFHSFLFHCRLFIWINIAWNEKYFVYASLFPEACVSERQISRVFWTMRNSRFPQFAETEPHSESTLLSSQVLTWEYLVLPGFLRFTWRILSHRYAVRDETTCACFHFQRESSEELSWALNYIIPPFFCNIIYYWICFCLRCFWLLQFLAASKIYSRKSFVD